MSCVRQYRFRFQLVAENLQSCDNGLKLRLEEDHGVELHFEEIHDIQTADFYKGGQLCFPVRVKRRSQVLITGDKEDVIKVLEKFERMDSKTDILSATLRKDQATGNKKFEKRISNAKKESLKQVASIRRESTNNILSVRRDEERQVRVTC